MKLTLEQEQEFLNIDNQLTNLEAELEPLKLKLEKLMSDKDDILKKWAVSFVDLLSDDRKYYLFNRLNEVFEADQEETAEEDNQETTKDDNQ